MPHQQDKPNRMVWIDTAKGIGILLVVFNHLSLYLHLSETYSTIALLDEIMGSIDMPIFCDFRYSKQTTRNIICLH